MFDRHPMTVPQRELLRKFLISTALSSFTMMLVQLLLPVELSLVRSGWYLLVISLMALMTFQLYFRRLVGFETTKKFKYAGTVFPSLVLLIALMGLPVIAVNFVDAATRLIHTLDTPAELNTSAGEYVKFKSIIPLHDESEREVYFWQTKEGKYSNHDQEHAQVTYYIPVGPPVDDSLHRFWVKWRYEAESSYDLTDQQIEEFRNNFVQSCARQITIMKMDTVCYFSHRQLAYNKLPDTRHKSQEGEVTVLIPNFETPADEARDYLILFIGSFLILFLLFMLSVSNLKTTSAPASAESVGQI